MIKKTAIMLGIILTTQLISCQKMDDYKTEKFEWDGDATAPEGYPMWIIYPHSFILSDGYEVMITISLSFYLSTTIKILC